MSENKNNLFVRIVTAIIIIVYIVFSIVSMGSEKIAEIGAYSLILVAIAIFWLIIRRFSDSNRKQNIVEDKPKVEKNNVPNEEENDKVEDIDLKGCAKVILVLLGILILFGVLVAILTSSTTVNTGVGYIVVILILGFGGIYFYNEINKDDKN